MTVGLGARLAIGLAVTLAVAVPAMAYVGPGAGFALLGSFLVVLTTIVVALLSLLIWPFRAVWRLLHRSRRPKPSIRRLVVVGLDGQDPRLTDRFRAEGRLPNFDRLAAMGCYHPIATTFPSVSPVAWSSFSTGTQPGKHNIFDFLDRDRRTYLPKLSSTHIGTVDRFLRLGRWRVPLGRPALTLLRRSKPFWTVLGEHGFWSTVLRVPITFPPDRFRGAELSAMAVPDLLGSQGTFLLLTTRPTGERFKEGGLRLPLERRGDRFEGSLPGPDNLFLEGSPAMQLPLTVEVDRGAGRATVRVDGERLELAPQQLSPWTRVAFRAAPGIKVSALCRMMITEMGDELSLYVTPLNIDPDKPAMPISHPSYYATYLAKRIGPYATLGLAEDTWALNERVIDDQAFLTQARDIDGERQAMFFAALDRLRQGALVCVFDATDRIQHMFWRYLEDGHPAPTDGGEAGREAIARLYEDNDRLVGKVLDRLRDGDVLMVLSDHGFTSFRRGVNLNRWLLDHGYLTLQEGADGHAEWLAGVDWPRTRAYALGLTGLYLNVAGREAQGIVKPGPEAAALRAELVGALSGLRDEERGEVAVNEVFETARLYDGPYAGNAPDLLIGYNHGYRVSWDSATGVVAAPLFEDNTKAWSGDHCVDPRIVPGVFFCSRPIARDDPSLIDIAPTALTLFGITPPRYMEGRPLFAGPGARSPEAAAG